ncbi:hypothetical protein MNBD_ALPHA06-1088 [hydrothermal vent metagenome]|uniref:Uncharacterized protein n=1 Tax=hydrothermal vent metagenome TaxID=652676 RepID=A0A3B0RPM0_9ZZZZ
MGFDPSFAILADGIALPYQNLLDQFRFSTGTCDTSATVLPTGPLTGSHINRFKRKFERRKHYEDQLMIDDRNAMSTLVQKIGGSTSETNGQFDWKIPAECECSAEIQALIKQLTERDQSRITKYQADYYILAEAIRNRS